MKASGTIRKYVLCVSAPLVVFFSVATAPAQIIWSDNFSGATGTSVTFGAGSGGWNYGNLTPTGDLNGQYSGNGQWSTPGGNWSMTLTAKQNAVGTEAGIVWQNNTLDTTAYGNLQSPNFNLATLTGWTAGAFTLSEIQTLDFTYDYTASGFTHSIGTVFMINGGVVSPYSFDSTPAGPGAGIPINVSTWTTAQQNTFLTDINNNNGIMQIGFTYPGGVSDAAGDSFAIANLQLSVTPAPEPSTSAMFMGGGLAMLICIQKYRRSKV